MLCELGAKSFCEVAKKRSTQFQCLYALWPLFLLLRDLLAPTCDDDLVAIVLREYHPKAVVMLIGPTKALRNR